MIYSKIFRLIQKYDKIVLARHIGPDPDALASTLGLRDSIRLTFPKKEVYAVGAFASNFKYLGHVDKFDESMYDNALMIVLDNPDIKRIDGVDYTKFEKRIKIDHHPFVEEFCDIEWIDDTASSASQMVLELIFNTRLKLNTKIAEKLFAGIVSDTDRFLYSYTTPKTLKLVSRLIEETNLDFRSVYNNLYLRPIKEIRFQGYIANNLTITPNGFAYIKLNDEILKEYNVDSSTAGNMVNNFNYINEIYAWAMFSLDKANNVIKASIRSRGPVINEIASHFNGGGHALASGARLKDFNEVDKLVLELDEACRVYTSFIKETTEE